MARFDIILKPSEGVFLNNNLYFRAFADFYGFNLTVASGSYCYISNCTPRPNHWLGAPRLEVLPIFSFDEFKVTINSLSTNPNDPTILAAIPFYDDDNNVLAYACYAAFNNQSYSPSYPEFFQFTSSNGKWSGKYPTGGDSIYRTVRGMGYSSSSNYVNIRPYINIVQKCFGIILTNVYSNGNYLSSISTQAPYDFYLSLDYEKFGNSIGGTIETVEISEAYGTVSTPGGYTGGTFDDSSDTISLPATPAAGVSSAGFVNIYNPSFGALQQFGAELFPDLSFSPVSQSGSPSTVTDALVSMAQVLVDFGNQIPQIIDMYINSNLINYVIDCHIIPVAPTTGGAASIKVGFKTFSAIVPVVTSDYVDFDCGSLNIGEYYANFIDYAPYTRAKLFLPFVGFVDLAPEYFQSGTLQVVYRFNIIDGSFMAFVISTSSKSKLSNSVIAQYGGNACVHIPITGLNYSSMVSGVVGAVQAVASAQPGAGTAAQAVNSAIDIANSKPPFQQSNGYNATTSFLGVRKPYLIIERSVSNFSRDYDNEKGIPSNISRSFAQLSGFTAASDVHLDGIAGATSEDLEEIKRLLSEGVIF